MIMPMCEHAHLWRSPSDSRITVLVIISLFPRSPERPHSKSQALGRTIGMTKRFTGALFATLLALVTFVGQMDAATVTVQQTVGASPFGIAVDATHDTVYVSRGTTTSNSMLTRLSANNAFT